MSAAPMPWEEAAQQQMPWDEAKASQSDSAKQIEANPPGVPKPPNPIEQEIHRPGGRFSDEANPGVSEGAGLREGLGSWVEQGPGAMVHAPVDVARGDFARGTHNLLSGAMNTMAPAAPFVAAVAPVAAAGGSAGGYLFGKGARKGAEYLGATPDQADVAEDVGNFAGGYMGARGASVARDIGRAGFPAIKAAAKELPVAAIRRIPYVGKVASDVYRAGRAAIPPTVEPVYPGAHLPEAPGPVTNAWHGPDEYPVTNTMHGPETPPPVTNALHGPEAPPVEVLRARGLATGSYAPVEPAAGLGRIPIRRELPPRSVGAINPDSPWGGYFDTAPPVSQPNEAFETRGLPQDIRGMAENEDRARLSEAKSEWFARNGPQKTKGELTGTARPPSNPIAGKRWDWETPRGGEEPSPRGLTTTPAPDDDMTNIFQRSADQAKAARMRFNKTPISARMGATNGEAEATRVPVAGATGAREAVPESRRPSAPTAAGTTTEIRVPGEERTYPVHYQVRELANVQPSHSGLTFDANESYALTNDRDYSNALNQEKVVTNSAPGRFDPSYHITDNPDASNGPVVIDSDGNALGGNGRAMIMQRVYKYNPEGATAYRNMLAQKAPQFGLDPAAISKMKQPVLVREISDTDLGPATNKQAAITDFNKQGTAQMTPAERAIADSRRVSQDTLDSIAVRLENAGPNATMADILEGRAGTQVLDELIKDGVITPQERAGLATGNELTPAGKERIGKLTVARFFRDPTQIDQTPPIIRNKLEAIAAPLARVDGLRGWDLTEHIQGALDLLDEARTHNISNLDDLLNQGGFWGNTRYSPEAIALAKQLQSTPTRILAKAVRRYAQDAADSERPMFTEAAIQPKRAFQEAFPQ